MHLVFKFRILLYVLTSRSIIVSTETLVRVLLEATLPVTSLLVSFAFMSFFGCMGVFLRIIMCLTVSVF